MARGRPHDRSKSDQRVCQAARYANAAEYRERTSISAEQQEERIAAVNADCNVQDAPRRRRGQKSKDRKTKAFAARVSARGTSCRGSGSAKRKADKRLEHLLGKAAGRGKFWCMCSCFEWIELPSRGQAEAGMRCSITIASTRKVKDVLALHCVPRRASSFLKDQWAFLGSVQ